MKYIPTCPTGGIKSENNRRLNKILSLSRNKIREVANGTIICTGNIADGGIRSKKSYPKAEHYSKNNQWWNKIRKKYLMVE